MKKLRLILSITLACFLFFSCGQRKSPEKKMDELDNQHFSLMEQGKYEESLKVALEMEEMSRLTGDSMKPWYYLKIADSYNGMQNYQKSIEWIGKAIYEKGFKNYKIFLMPKYKRLHADSVFQKLITAMRDRIGLDHPAKDFKIPLVNGDNLTLSSLKGKVVLIDFWDIRCGPCIKALPELKSYYEQFHNYGFEIIGISLDTEKDLLMKFLCKNKLPWKIACTYKGFYKDESSNLYGINATPSTWLVDRKGILRYNEINGEELKTAIELLIKE
jgi:peroxiredoxin